MTILGKGVGVLMKNSGSGSPSYVTEDKPDDSQVTYPFKVTVKNAGDNKDVYVMPGTANNRMVKIGGSYLDASAAPKLSFTTFSSSGKKIVALKITYGAASFFPDNSEIILADNEEAIVDSNDYGYLQIASITGTNVDGKARITGVFQYIHACQIVIRSKPGSGDAYWAFLSR